jgi:hypothetical protein
MASAQVDGRSYLYFGDVGDNAEHRKEVVVHRVEEPKGVGETRITAIETYTVTYPDKAHNCEAMFVTSTGDVWVVTKNAGGNAKVFVLPRPPKSGRYAFRHVGDVFVDTGGFGGKNVTAGDVSPDGRHVVLRTYSGALEFPVPERFEDWIKSPPLAVRTAIEVQGEAVCYSRDGRGLVTTSEGSPCPVSLAALKGP